MMGGYSAPPAVHSSLDRTTKAETIILTSQTDVLRRNHGTRFGVGHELLHHVETRTTQRSSNHSITSSVRACSEGGMVRASALAVLRLMRALSPVAPVGLLDF